MPQTVRKGSAIGLLRSLSGDQLNPLAISGAVEGVVDEAVLRRLVELAEAEWGR